MPDDTALLFTLETLRERGALGEADLPRAVAHADRFVAALPSTCRRLIDLGSGGGLPGLVIAARRPDLVTVLTDRRQRRTDLLRLACSQLGLDESVTVVAGDVVALGRDPQFAGKFDVVTARSFGEPMWALECARPFLRETGWFIVSEPPLSTDDRWPSPAVSRLGFRSVGATDGLHRLERASMFHVEQAASEPATHVSRET